MKQFALAVCAVALVACARSEQAATDTAGATAAAAMPATPAPIRVGDISGAWAVKGRSAATDSAIIDFDFVTTSDSTYTMTFASGQKVSGRIVSIAGDSIVIEAGPYPSVLRKGVQVRTTSTLRLQDGKLVGTTTARYITKGADSVLIVRTEGTRKP